MCRWRLSFSPSPIGQKNLEAIIFTSRQNNCSGDHKEWNAKGCGSGMELPGPPEKKTWHGSDQRKNRSGFESYWIHHYIFSSNTYTIIWIIFLKKSLYQDIKLLLKTFTLLYILLKKNQIIEGFWNIMYRMDPTLRIQPKAPRSISGSDHNTKIRSGSGFDESPGSWGRE